MLESSFTACMAGRLVGWQAGLQPDSQATERGWWERRVVLVMCWICFFLFWTVPLRRACSIPCRVPHSISLCVCPSHHLRLPLKHPTGATFSVTFSSPLQLHFDFFLPFLPSCLSLSLCFMLICIAVFQYLHFKFPFANAVRLSQSGSLSVFSSLPHCFSWSLAASLAACLSVSIPLPLHVSASTSLSASSTHSPPLHYSIWALMRSQISSYREMYFSQEPLTLPYFHFLLWSITVFNIYNSLLIGPSYSFGCSMLPLSPSLTKSLSFWVTRSSDLCESFLLRKVSLLRLPLPCIGWMMNYNFSSGVLDFFARSSGCCACLTSPLMPEDD